MNELNSLISKSNAPVLSQRTASNAKATSERQDLTAVSGNFVAPVKKPEPTLGLVVNSVTAEKPEKEVQISDRQLEKAVVQLKDYTQRIDRKLAFSVDEESGRSVVKVLDPETDEVIRQLPSEEVLEIIHFIESQQDEGNVATGLLIQEQV